MTTLQELTADFRDLASQAEDILREQVRQGIEPLVLASEEILHETEALLARLADLERQLGAACVEAEWGYEVQATPGLVTLFEEDIYFREESRSLVITLPTGKLRITASNAAACELREFLHDRLDRLETEVTVYRARAEYYQERYEWLLRQVAAES